MAYPQPLLWNGKVRCFASVNLGCGQSASTVDSSLFGWRSVILRNFGLLYWGCESLRPSHTVLVSAFCRLPIESAPALDRFSRTGLYSPGFRTRNLSPST